VWQPPDCARAWREIDAAILDRGVFSCQALPYYCVPRTTPYQDWHTDPTNDWTPLFKGSESLIRSTTLTP